MEEEKREHKMKMKKMEKEMESVFETKVKEKRNRLKESQKDLERKHENVSVTIQFVFLKKMIKAKTALRARSGRFGAATSRVRARKDGLGDARWKWQGKFWTWNYRFLKLFWN